MILSHRSRLNAARSLNDIQQGDWVRRALGSRKVGLVEETQDGWAWVLWGNDRRDYLPFCALRKIKPAGHDLDAKR